ncbi:MAG: pentapeptide repeat-containing protein [bacterium]|nr:pentapeptide repeat-containing protein [bacterium]
MTDERKGLAKGFSAALINRIGTVVLILVITLVGVSIAGYIFKWGWTGLRWSGEDGSKTFKTLWDWLGLMIIPIVLAAGAFWFKRTTERVEKDIASRTEKERAQEAAMEIYFDRMSDLLLDKDPLLKSEPNSAAREMAATRTLAVLRRLDGNRRNQVFQFLGDACLLGRPEKKAPPSGMVTKPMIPMILKPLARKADPFSVLEDRSIEGMNLSRANLGEVNLSGASMIGTNLVEANLRLSNLTGVRLCEADLAGADLYGAKLEAADLGSAKLEAVNLVEANLEGAVLEEANLKGAYLTSACLKGAFVSRADLNGVVLHGANLEGASMVETNLEGADLELANLVGTVGLTCEQLRLAKNWEKAYRDEALACDAEIPKPPKDMTGFTPVIPDSLNF